MKRIIQLLFTILSFGFSFAQVTIHQESFESAPAGVGTNYSAVTEFGGADANDYWQRIDITGNGKDEINAGVTGGDGTKMYAGEDFNEQILTLKDVDVSAYTDRKVLVALGSGEQNKYDATDYIEIYVKKDGGAESLVGAWYGENFNKRMYQDTDLNGIHNGVNQLSKALTDYTFDITGTFDDLQVIIKMQAGSGDEVLIVDNVRIRGTLAATDTKADFNLATSSVSESAGTYNLTIDVANPDATNTTTATVELTAGDASLTDDFAAIGNTISVVIPANTSSFNYTLDINDNAVCTSNGDLEFEITAVTGGQGTPSVGTQNTHVLTVSDDEGTSGVFKTLSFEGSDTWTYSGGGTTNSTTNKFFGTTSYRIGGSNNLTTDNVSLVGYTNVTLGVAFASVGCDSNEDLFLDISYDNGTSWAGTGSVKLVDGFSNANINMGSTNGSNPTTVASNPWIVNILDAETQIRVRLRTVGLDGSEYYFVDDIILSGDFCPVACAEPTSDAVFHINSPQSLTETSATLNFTVGDGDKRIVVLKENSSISFVPADNSTYAANSAFGTGTDVGTGEYVVYNDTSNTVDVTNLTPGTEYYSTIYEYGCAPGSEDYFTSGTPAIDTFLTVPEDPTSFTEGCTGATTLDLSWSAPSDGDFDGYLLVARQGATPHAVTSLDPSSQTFNLDYSSAPTYGGGSRVLYNGTGTTAAITGLTNGVSYTFEVLAYKIGTSEYRYSDGTTTSETIDLEDVSGEAASNGDMEVEVVWANPAALCFDEILVVANETSGIGFSPSGDGTAYTANAMYAAADQVVYKGTGVTETITGLTNGTTYYFEIFVRKGTDWSTGVEVSAIPNTATIFDPGDMAIVAFNTFNGTSDEFCFFAFKDITEGTSIDFTDNGYGRVTAGEWGDTEGTIRITRNSGGTIAAGTTICLEGDGNDDSDFQIYNCGTLDDANWSITSLNGSFDFNFNTSDQIWIMQGGSWVNPSGSHNATYTGNLTYGFTATGWEASPNFASTSGSQLFEGMECYNTDVDGVANSDKVKYTGPTTVANQRTWITRINDQSNWTGYSSNANYNSGGSDYIGSCITFNIDNSSGFSAGMWEGDEDSNWFNCANWQDLKVPDETIDVTILTDASFGAKIDDTAQFASLHGNKANCKSLDIEGGLLVELNDANDSLIIEENLIIRFYNILSTNYAGKLYNDEGGFVNVKGNITIEDGALLDMHPLTGGTNSTLMIGGNWTDNNVVDNTLQGFYETDSKVIFNGTGQQTISDATGTEDFHDVTIAKTAQSKLNLEDTIEVKNVLSFESGIVKTNDNKVYVSAGNVGDIIGYDAPNGTGTYSNDRYVEGNLEREITSSASYEFPVGDDPAALGYNPIVLTIQSGTGSATGKFVNGAPGTITVNDASKTCSGAPVLIHYSTMTGLGYWNFTSATSYDYDVMLHPNSANTNTDPNSDGKYRALKAPTGTGGGAWPAGSGTDGDFCSVSSNYFAIPGVGYTGFSDFGVGGGAGGPALPVELMYFKAKINGEKSVLLTWATATEINNDFFTIEKSADGENFVEVERVEGMGNYSGKMDYRIIDEEAYDGVSYYRLKQTDFDGTSTYSNIEVVNFKSNMDSDFSVYPVPFSSNLNIISNNQNLVSAAVFDLSGKLVARDSFEGYRTLDLNQLSPGAYILQLTSAQKTETIRLVKN